MKSLVDAHNELLAYTLEQAKYDPSFRHQLVVDAWAAQHSNEKSKNIGIVFALIGLYLHIEKGFNGKMVQEAHIYLARKRKQWPHFKFPKNRGDMTAFDVVKASPGKERDEMIEKWCMSVWESWKENHKQIEDLIRKEMDLLD